MNKDKLESIYKNKLKENGITALHEVERLEVPGGWLYINSVTVVMSMPKIIEVSTSSTFVPEPVKEETKVDSRVRCSECGGIAQRIIDEDSALPVRDRWHCPDCNIYWPV